MARSPVFFPDEPRAGGPKANASFADAGHTVNGQKPARPQGPREPETVVTQSAQTEPRDEWWIQVRGMAYGPYTARQVRGFIGEGRVRTSTLVSRDRNGGWNEARKEGAFADALTQSRPAAANSNAGATESASTAANLFVSAEIHSGAWNAFMAALERMGRVAELAPGFWLVRSPFSSGVIRNTLSQTLQRGDRFVVIDATRDRLAWYNMGPGVDVAIREIWNAPLDTSKYQA
jgi:hypothetical protein